MKMKVIITLYVEDKDWATEDQAKADLKNMDDAEIWAVAYHTDYQYKQVQ